MSRCCVVYAVVSMKKKKRNNFQNLQSIYIVMQEREQVFVGSFIHG